MDALPDDFSFMLEYDDVSTALAHIFFGYQARVADLLLAEKTMEAALNEVGEKPWDFVNRALNATDFGYNVKPPSAAITKDYTPLLCRTDDPNINIGFNDLSSGERIILRTILWFYNSQWNKISPKLFLLDEPDAHLHPSLTRQFLDVLKDVLVEQNNVRVILSTHSPSTVALAPDDSIFVMHRDAPRIRKTSKPEAIGVLTSGMVIVSPGTKFVLVEDEDDKSFYDVVRDILKEKNGSLALKSAPTLVFMPASLGHGPSKQSGGKGAVARWLQKLDDEPLRQMFFGLIDADNGNTPTQRMHVIGRYSFENYLWDPIIVFAALMDQKAAPALAGIKTNPGDEHLLRELPASGLQSIVDCVLHKVEPHLGTLSQADRNFVKVQFDNDIQVDYPNWMLRKQGKILSQEFRAAFNTNRILEQQQLLKSYMRVRLVPTELCECLKRLQDA